MTTTAKILFQLNTSSCIPFGHREMVETLGITWEEYRKTVELLVARGLVRSTKYTIIPR